MCSLPLLDPEPACWVWCSDGRVKLKIEKVKTEISNFFNFNLTERVKTLFFLHFTYLTLILAAWFEK
jgi:hypothetical protein